MDTDIADVEVIVSWLRKVADALAGELPRVPVETTYVEDEA